MGLSISPNDSLIALREFSQGGYDIWLRGVHDGRHSRLTFDAADALEYVAGYVPLNDVTARDLQKTDGQWTRAKGFDTFCPVGPMVPAAGIDWGRLEIVCRVNGHLRQHGRGEQMVFGIPRLIEYTTSIMTLR